MTTESWLECICLMYFLPHVRRLHAAKWGNECQNIFNNTHVCYNDNLFQGFMTRKLKTLVKKSQTRFSYPGLDIPQWLFTLHTVLRKCNICTYITDIQILVIWLVEFTSRGIHYYSHPHRRSCSPMGNSISHSTVRIILVPNVFEQWCAAAKTKEHLCKRLWSDHEYE